jgi:TP901 family phage tail tape measure protein
MADTGTTNAAATLILDVDTTVAATKVGTLQAAIAGLNTGGAATPNPQITRLEKDLVEVRAALASTTRAYDALEAKLKTGAGAGGAARSLAKVDSTLKTIRYNAVEAGRALDFSGKRSVQDLVRQFDSLSGASKASASNVKNAVAALTIDNSGTSGLRAYYQQLVGVKASVNDIARAKALVNSLDLKVINAVEAGKVREAAKAANDLARAKTLVSSLELRVISAAEAGKVREAEKATNDLARAKSLVNSLQIRVVRDDDVAKIREAAKATKELAAASQLNLLGQRQQQLRNTGIAFNNAMLTEQARAYDSIGKKILATQAIVKQFGEAQARTFLGPSREHLIGQIPHLERYRAVVRGAGTAARDAAVHTHAMALAHDTLHASLRGVTGMLGGLWLSYARLVPVLLAAAAATKAVKDSTLGGLDTSFKAQFIATVDTKGLVQGEELRAVRGGILRDLTEVARDSVFTVEENADALHKLSLAGVDAARGIGLLETASNAAIFAQKGLSETTGMVLDTMFNFGLASSDAGIMADNFERASDVMSFTAIAVNASFDDIAKAFTNITGVAGSFNIEIEEASALLANLAQTGIRGARAGTYVRNFFDDLMGAPISRRAEAAMKQVGIQRFDPGAETEFAASKFIDDAISKVKKLSFVEQQDFLRAATNQRSRRVWRQELVSSYNEETTLLRRVSELAEKAQGSLAKMATGLKDSGKLTILLAQAAYNASVIDAFQSADADSGFQEIGKRLQSTFNSDEFKAMMKSLVASTVEFLKVLTDVFSYIIKNQDTIKRALSTALDVAVIAGFALAFTKSFKLITASVTAATGALASFRTAQAAAAAMAAAGGFVGPLPAAAPLAASAKAAAVGVGGAVIGAGILGISYLEGRKLDHSKKSLEEVNAELADLQKRVTRLNQTDDTTGFAANEIAKYEERIKSLTVAAKEKAAETTSELVTGRIKSITQELENQVTDILDTQSKVERVLNAGLYKGDASLSLRLSTTKTTLEALSQVEKKYSDEITASREKLQKLRETSGSPLSIDSEVRVLEGLTASAHKASEAIDKLRTQRVTDVEKSVFSRISDEARKAGLDSTKAVKEMVAGYDESFQKLMLNEEALAAVRRTVALEQSEQFLVQAKEFEAKVAMAASPALAASFAEQSIAAREAAKELKSLAHVIDLVSQAKAFLAGTAPVTQDMIIRMSTTELRAMADSLKTVAEQANLTKQAIREMSIASLGAQLSEASASGDADRAAVLSNLISNQMAAWVALDAAEKRKSGARPRRDFSEDRMAKDAAASAKRISAEEIKRSKQSSDIIQKNLELYRAKRLISEGEFNQALLRLSEARAYQAAVATQKELAEIDRRLNDPKITKVARQQLGNARTEALERLKTEQGDAATQVEGDRIDRLKEEAGLISGHRDALAQLNEERRLGLATELESFNLTKEGDPVRLAGLQAQLVAAQAFHAAMAKATSDISDNEGNPELQEQLRHRLAMITESSAAAGEAARLQGEQIMAQQRTFEYGWEQAFNKFVADASDGASKAEGIFNTLTQGFNSSLTEFLINPMDKGFKGLLASWGRMLERMIAEAVAADITNRVFGSATTGGGGKSRTGGWIDLAMAAASAYFGGSTQAAAPVVERSFQAAALLKSADGNAFAGQGAARFAAGGAFGKGEVLTHPTFFRFSQGGAFRTGVAGEAGPEGALPLKRMSNGKLGVFAGGTGGGTTVIQNIHVNGDRAPDLRRAAGQGSREGLAFMANAQRYA